jgi:UDP-GlcNAc:undecaprenyl-phosphate GlcNAc-1-phosphate transferase
MFTQYLSGFVALVFCLAALPIVKRLARHFNLYDAPGPLKIHHGSIPRLGGIAMLIGILAGSLTLYKVAPKPSFLPIVVFVLVWAVGLVDDVRSLAAVLRFCVQIASGAVLWLAGWRLQWFSSELLDLVATCLFVAFLINAINLLDGMDGLAASTAALVSTGFLLISAGGPNVLETTVASSLLGVSIGILAVNAPPAEMFMGDSGSTLIGIALAFLSLNWVRAQSDPHSILTPLIFLGVPLADAALAILRRARSRKKLFTGDRRHFYDILLQRGWTVESVLRVSVGATALLVLAGWLCVRGFAGAWLTGMVVGCGLATGAYLLGSLQPDLSAVQVQANPQGTPVGSGLE